MIFILKIIFLGILLILTSCGSHIDIEVLKEGANNERFQAIPQTQTSNATLSSITHKSIAIEVPKDYIPSVPSKTYFYVCNTTQSPTCDPLKEDYIILTKSSERLFGNFSNLSGSGDTYKYIMQTLDDDKNKLYEATGQFTLKHRPGSIDLNYANQGIAMMDFKSASYQVRDLLFLPSDKMLLVGSFNPAADSDFLVMRLNPDGSLDESFNNLGYIWIDINGHDDHAGKVRLLSNGNYVISGTASNGADTDAVVVVISPQGDLVTSFNTNGKFIYDSGNGDDRGSALYIDESDNIFLGGASHDGSTQNFFLSKMDSSANLDFSFDSDGIVINDIRSTAHDVIIDIEKDSFGNLVIAGTSDAGPDDSDPVVASYSATSGALISGFGSGGIITLGVGTESQDAVGIEVNTDGTLILGVGSIIGTASARYIYKFLSDGSPDTSWQTNGVYVKTGSCCNTMFNISLLSDGRILVASGKWDSGNELAVDLHAVNGDLDSTFSGNGEFYLNLSGAQKARVVGENNAGELIVFGDDSRRILGAKLDTSGNLDTTYGDGGYLYLTGHGGEDYIISSTITAQNNIIFAGNNDQSVLTGSLNSNGQINLDYNSTGSWSGRVSCCRFINDVLQLSTGDHITIGQQWGTGRDFHIEKWSATHNNIVSELFHLGSGSEQAYSAVEAQNGKILIIGERGDDMAIIRVNNDLTLDTSFATSGIAIIDIAGGDDNGRAITTLSDGSIIAAGFVDDTDDDFLIIKLDPSGSLDNSFASSGTLRYDFSESNLNDRATTLLVLENDRILVGGFVENALNKDAALLMIDSNGNIVTSFGDNGRLIIDAQSEDDEFKKIIKAENYFLAVGHSYNNTDSDALAVAFSSTGELYEDFAGQGIYLYDSSRGDDFFKGAHFISNKYIMLTGQSLSVLNDIDALAIRLHK